MSKVGTRVTTGPNVEGEQSDRVWVSVDAAASPKSNSWRHFGFLVSGSEEEEKARTDRKQAADTHLRPSVAHRGTLTVQSVFCRADV